MLKKLSFGVIFYKIYYFPKSFFQQCLHEGFTTIALKKWSQYRMEQAAYRLKTVNQTTVSKELEIHFLTGKNFWYQTCFCAYSFI